MNRIRAAIFGLTVAGTLTGGLAFADYANPNSTYAPDQGRPTQTTPAPEASAKPGTKPTLLVEFQSGQSAIPDSFKSNLASFADYLKKHDTSRAEIAGYADATGSQTNNPALAQQRADAVKNYLVNQFGIVADRIQAKGYGPITDRPTNSTGLGRQADRRAYGTIVDLKSRS